MIVIYEIYFEHLICQKQENNSFLFFCRILGTYFNLDLLIVVKNAFLKIEND